MREVSWTKSMRRESERHMALWALRGYNYYAPFGATDPKELKHFDVLYFPTLFPTGKFGESHACPVPITISEYSKSLLLNRDSRFSKESHYVFFLLWQEMRELAAGVYSLMKGTRRHALPVGEFMDRFSSSDEDVEANLSTVFTNMRGSKQY